MTKVGRGSYVSLCKVCGNTLHNYELVTFPVGLCEHCRDAARFPNLSMPADCYFGPGALGAETARRP